MTRPDVPTRTSTAPSSTAAGVIGFHPRVDEERRQPARCRQPHHHHHGDAVRLERIQDAAGTPLRAWPDTTRKPVDIDRCVTGMPASSGAATALLIPGTISNGNAGVRERQRLFPAAAEHERVAALEPDDALAAARGANHQPVDELLETAWRPARFPTKIAATGGARPSTVGIDQRVVQHEVGLGQSPGGPRVSRSGSPGPAPTSATVPGAAHRRLLRLIVLPTKRSGRLSLPTRRLAASRKACRALRAAAAVAPSIGMPSASHCRRASRAQFPSTRPDRRAVQRLQRFTHQAGQRRRLAIGRHRDRSRLPVAAPRPDTRWRFRCRPPRSRTGSASCAAAATARFTSGGAAATTYHAPSRSSARNGRRTTSTGAPAIASTTSGATTVTDASASMSERSLLAATGPPPTTTTRRPASLRNTGKTAIKRPEKTKARKAVWPAGLWFLAADRFYAVSIVYGARPRPRRPPGLPGNNRRRSGACSRRQTTECRGVLSSSGRAPARLFAKTDTSATTGRPFS